MKIKKFAIIGINKGNGHPFSFSAIINGYEKKTFFKFCKYRTIKNYIKKKQKPRSIFKNFKIEYIATQNNRISREISKSCKIPFVLKRISDIPKKVDGVILARDDFIYNNFIIKFCLKNNISLFVDKQISKDINFLKLHKKKIFAFKKLYGGSGVSYCDSFLKFKKDYLKEKFIIKKIICTSKGKWINYGQHLLDPIYDLFNFTKLKLKCIKKTGKEQILQTNISKTRCDLIFKGNNYNKIKFTFYTDKGKKIVSFDNAYEAFSRMLINYLKNYRTNNNLGIKKLYAISNNILNGQKILNKYDNKR